VKKEFVPEKRKVYRPKSKGRGQIEKIAEKSALSWKGLQPKERGRNPFLMWEKTYTIHLGGER